VYEGEFQSGKPHGKGAMHYKGKKAIFKGEWEKGNKVAGKMTSTTDAGKVFKGDWRDMEIVVEVSDDFGKE